jgi:uncharacterized protein (TIGR03435 family)
MLIRGSFPVIARFLLALFALAVPCAFGQMGMYGPVTTPTAREVNAALERRIRTTLQAFVESGQAVLQAEPNRIPRPDENKPNFPPSYMLHVSPSQSERRGNFGGDDFWALEGYTLKEAIDAIYNVNSVLVHLPGSLDDDKRYDFALVLPEPEDQEKMKDRLNQGLQDYFHLTARQESRLVDAYVVTTAPDRKPPAVRPPANERMGGSMGTSTVIEFGNAGGLDEPLAGTKPLSIGAIRSVSVDGTADEFCRTLEAELDRPVVNETNLQGEFEFRVEGSKGVRNDFLKNLRDQLGLVITPAQRNVEILVFEPR